MKYTVDIDGDSDAEVVTSVLGIVLTDAEAARICAKAWRYHYNRLQDDLSRSGNSEDRCHGGAPDESE